MRTTAWLVLLGSILAFTVRESAPVAVLSFPIAVGDDCELLCFDDGEFDCFPGEEHHAFEPSGELAEWMHNGGAHSPSSPCKSGTCPTKHGPMCVRFGAQELTVDSFEELRVALVDGDIAAVRGVMDRHAGQITFNRERSAIQVLNCSGSVRAHLPLKSDLALGLMTEQ